MAVKELPNRSYREAEAMLADSLRPIAGAALRRSSIDVVYSDGS